MSPQSPAMGGLDPVVLLDGLPDLVFVVDAKGLLRYVNDAGQRQLRWTRAEWVGRSVLDVLHGDDLAAGMAAIGTMHGKSHGSPIELRVADADGAWHWMEVLGVNHLQNDEIGGLVCVARDITQRRMWEVAGADVTRFQQVIHHSPSITMLLDAAGVVTSVNGAFTRLLGFDNSMVVGESLAAFVGEESLGDFQDAIQCLASGSRNVAVEVAMRRFDNPDLRPIRFELANFSDDPVLAGIVVSGHDVTELQRVREELEHMARHDALTGLANRSLLLSRLDSYLEVDHSVGVVFIDLDRFKPVNDLFGHEAGDALLREVARRLEHAVRPGDLVARVGGDEFVALAPGIGGWAAASALADRIESALSQPYDLEVGPVKIGASVGVAISDPFSTVISLLADADVRMYNAKSDRRGMTTRSMAERRRSATERRRLADELTAGLVRGEVVSHLQPIINLSNGELVGVEALARWNHPVLGLLSPNAFLDLVEDAGLDVPLGAAVLESSCHALAALNAGGLRPQLCLNLSIGQLADPDLCVDMTAMLNRHGLEMAQLVIEITERATLARHASVGMSSPDDTLRQLHAAGAQLSLDDFGTGYSSLTHVRRFPLTSLKLDQTFVAGMCDHAEDRAVVEVVVGLGKALSLLVVAEGVETLQQWDMLRALGCDHAQGYLMAAPMSPEIAVPWILDYVVSQRGVAASSAG